ncbi:MAG: hypothetical protein JWO38_1164 [Gemmataceae bacterium]|nr:hypothetical protein [Gemmataceae bacterium]
MAHSLIARPTNSVRNLTVAALLAWFLLALGGSLLGVFDSEPRPPVPLGLAVVVPVAVFAFCYVTSGVFRQFVLSLDLRILTVAQTWRVGGIVFLVLHQRGALPGVFALPAGWGDIAIGITAPVLAWYWKPPFPYKTFIVWNVLGGLDLVMAVSLGVLASATPVGILAGDVTTGIMSQFPLSLIPTFFVPLFLILHLISLIRARKGAP